MNSIMLHPDLLNYHEQLKTHSLYKKIQTQKELQIFMETHVFAVWDFMSLLKRLQKEITCVEIPWNPSPYPKTVVRLINEIVLGEESDKDFEGKACDHFTLYIRAMEDLNANPERLLKFSKNLDYGLCTPAEKNFVEFNLNLSTNGKIHEVAAAFFFGREKLIPDMFTSILGDLTQNFDSRAEINFPNLRYYLKRHIDIDGGEHSHQAEDCLKSLCENDETKWEEARIAGVQSLKLRSALWYEVENKIVSKKSHL
ncbi:MAG: DUF3050 domain-containing protein [Bacteriovorax sp.]|nr:DUF3050 domain-containing protein [Bacteriovorax sp.]